MRLRLFLIALLWVPAASEFACTICEGGEALANPDEMVTTPQGQTASCGTLEKHITKLPADACESLQYLAGGPCGCLGFDGTTGDEAQYDGVDTTSNTLRMAPRAESDPFVCSICERGEMRNPTGYTLNSVGLPVSCQELHDTRESISESVCARVQSFASIPCACDGEAATTSSTIETLIGGGSDSFMCSICGDGLIGNPNGIVVNDRGQSMTCAELESNRGSIPANMCSSLQDTALEPCECDFNQLAPDGTTIPETNLEATNSTGFEIEEVLSQCSICGDGEMTIPQGIVTTRQGKSARCDILEENPKEISQNACENIQVISRYPCGCVFPYQAPDTDILNDIVPFQCSICGGGEITISDGVVTTPEGQAAKCDILEANANTIPEDSCPEIQRIANDPCGCTRPEIATVENEEPSIGQGIDESLVCHVCGGAAQAIGIPGNMVTTPAGMFTCYSILSAGVLGAIPMEDCESVQTAVAQECGCYLDEPTAAPTEAPFICSVCDSGRVVTLPEGIIDVTNNVTCAQYEEVAAKGEVSEEQCSVLQQVSGEACGCEDPPTIPTVAPTSYECQVCGTGRMVGLPSAEFILPNLQTMSCADVQERAEAGIIQDFQCTQIQPLVREYCGCMDKPRTQAPTVFDCAICGEGLEVTNQDGVVVIPTQPDRTCAELMEAATNGHINANQCFLLHPFVQTPCGCVEVNSDMPSDSPSLSLTAPTFSPAPTDVMMRGDCFADLRDIQALERGIIDTTIKRKYVLCPGRTYQMGVWTEEGEIKDGQPFLALRPNVIYQCGHDGSRMNNCVLKGGDFGLASYYEVFKGIYESVPGVEVRGLTFESQNLFSVLLKSAGDITFTGCAFKVSLGFMCSLLFLSHGNSGSAILQYFSIQLYII